jgi:hypothetical protein
MRGAASGRFCDPDEVLNDELLRRRLSCRLSCREERAGTAFCAAKASATGSGCSPSKNFAIAIFA